MSSLLDDVLAQTGISPNLDNLTLKVGESVERIAQKVNANMQPQVTVGEGFTPNFSIGESDATIQNTQDVNYLDAKLAEYNKRKAEDSERWLSEENLTSSNPLVWGLANAANFGANVAGTVVNSFENMAAAGAASQRESLNNAIPEDIRDIRERQKLSNNKNSINSEIKQLENTLLNAEENGLSTTQQNQARARIELLRSQLDVKAPTAQELARLKEKSGIGFLETWQDALNWRDEYDATNKRLRGDPKNGVASLTGASEWGNNKSLDNLRERVADDDQGEFDRIVNDPNASFGDKAGAWGTRIGSFLEHAITNPGAVPEMFAESLPYMIPATAPAAALGAGSEIYARGTQEYRENYGRDTINNTDHAAIGALAAAMGGSSFIQGGLERTMVKGAFARESGGMIGSVTNAVRDKVNKASAATIAKTPYAGGALDLAVRGTTAATAGLSVPVGRTALAGVSEGLQEGFQNVIEQNAGLQGQIDQSELSESMALGGIMGGAIAAPGTAVDAGVQAYKGKVQNKQEEEIGSADTTDEDLMDPKSQNYNPTQAINREILKATSTTEEMTPEQITEAKAKVDSYYNATKRDLDNSEVALEKAKNLEKLEAEHEAWIQKRDEGLAKVQASGDQARIAEVTEYAANKTRDREAELARIRTNAENIGALEKTIEDNRKQLESAKKSYDQFDSWYQSKNPKQEAAPKNTGEEATQLLGAPSFGSATRMQELANDKSIPEATRKQLRTVSEALIAENQAKSLGEVNQNIMKGVKGYRGMAQYITEMQTAVQNNDTAQKRILERDIQRFHSGLQSKLAAVQEAQKHADELRSRSGRNEQVRVVRNTDGTWFADTDRTVKRSEFNKNNGFVVNSHRDDGTVGADTIVNALTSNIAAVESTRLALDEITNSSKASRTSQAPTPNMSFEEEMDAFNAQERTTGRDTSFRDNDPNARTVNPVPSVNPLENNEGDQVDNSGFTSTPVNPFSDMQTDLDAVQDESYDFNTDEFTGFDTQSQGDQAPVLESEVTPPTIETPVDAPAPIAEEQPAIETAPEPVTQVEQDLGPVDDDIPDELAINARKYPESKGWKRTELKKSNKYVKDNGDGTETIVNVDKVTGEKLLETKRNKEAVKAENEFKKGVKATEPKTYTSKHNAESEADVTIDGQEAEDLDGVSQERVPDIDVTDVSNSTLDSGAIDSSPEGALDVMNTSGLSYKETIEYESTKPLAEQNLIKTGFVQRMHDGINSPLVVYKNLPNKLLDLFHKLRGNSKSNSLVNTARVFYESMMGTKANESDTFATEAVIRHILTDVKDVQRMIKDKRPEYRFESYLDWFKVNGELEQNVATAIIVGALDWVGSYANADVATVKDINKMLWLKDEANIPFEVMDQLKYLGTYKNSVTEAMGKSIMRSLQLKQLAHVDEARKERLAQALGTAALAYLGEKGYVNLTKVPNSELMRLREEVKEYSGKDRTEGNPPSSNGETIFVKAALTTDEEGNVRMVPALEKLNKKLKGGLVQKLFGTDFAGKSISLKPIEDVKLSFNDMGSTLSKFQQGVVLKQQETPYALDTGMSQILDVAANNPAVNNALLRMLGFRDPSKSLAVRQVQVKSINDALVRSLGIVFNTKEQVGKGDFYLPINVWSNGRMGIGSDFNPQGDKVHRAFSSLRAEQAEIEISDVIFKGDSEDNLTSYGSFLRALGFRMDGVKVPGVPKGDGIDKATLRNYLPSLDAYINTNEVKAAAGALQRIMEGSDKPSHIKLVEDLIGQWGQGDVGQSAMTLSALNAIREYHNAKNNGRKAFTTSVTAESDGTNNGLAFTQTLMNTTTPSVSEAFGIYRRKENGVTNVPKYRETGGEDFYTILGTIKESLWNQAKVHPPIREAFEYLDNKFSGRNGAKRDMIPFNYGAGFEAIMKANSREFIEGIYDKVEQAVLNNDKDTYNKVIKSLNELIANHNYRVKNVEKYKGVVTPLLNTNTFNLEFKLDKATERALRSMDQAVRGKVIKDSLSTLMSSYVDARDKYNKISNVAFNLFAPVYNAKAFEHEAYYFQEDPQRAKMNEGLSKTEKREVMQEIRNYMPTLTTGLGKESLNGLASGIPLIKVKTNWSESKGVVVPFTRKINAGGMQYSNMTSNISNKIFAEPGVSGMALFIQSLDAYVTARVMQAFNVQNQHDSNSANAHDIIAVAKMQNEAFLDGVTLTHVGQSFVRAMMAPMRAYRDSTVYLDAKARNGLLQSVNDLADNLGIDPEQQYTAAEIQGILERNIRYFYNQDFGKMRNVMEWHAVNQYGTQGGEYIMTAAKRTTIGKRRIALDKAFEKDMAEARSLAEALAKALNSDEEAILNHEHYSTEVFDLNSAEQREVAAVKAETEANMPLSEFENDLIKYQKELKDPKRLVKFIQHKLGKYLKDANPKVAANAQMYNELLQLSLKSLDNLEVNIAGIGEDTSHMFGEEEANQRGVNAWFKHENGKSQINLRVGRGFKVDAKVVVHELVHGSTAVALTNLRAMKESGKVEPKYAKAMQSYDRLNTLYEHVKNNVTNMDSELDRYGVSNLDEFIATGLTYPEFMNKLSTITAPADVNYRLPKAGSVFRDMIDNLLGVFYNYFAPGKKYDAKQLSAYEALVIDTAQFVQRTQDTPALRSLPRVTELLGAPQEKAHEQVSQMKSSEVFATLPESGDASFDAHLLRAMERVTDRAFGSLPTSYDGSEYSPEHIWNNALQSGEKPYVTDALRNGFMMSAREQFAVEAIEVAMEASIRDKSLSAAYRELDVAFASAQKNLKVEDFAEGDWENMDQEDRATAQRKYEYVFDTSNPNYLPRFMAMAIGNKEVNKLLTMKVDRKARVPEMDNEWFNRAVSYLNDAVDKVTDKHLGDGASRDTNTRIGLIAKKFIDIDHKNRNKALEKIEQVMEAIDNKANSLLVAGGHKISDLASATKPKPRPGQPHKPSLGQIVRNTTIQTFSGKPLAVFDVIQDWRNQENPNTTLGFLGEIGNEVGNVSDNSKRVESLMRETKMHENNAQRLRTEIKKDVLGLFRNEGKDLTKEQRDAITYGVLRTDLQALSTGYSMGDVARFIQSTAARKSEILRLEKVLSPTHIQRARDLARYMQTGKGNEILVKNAFGIVAGAGLPNPNMNPDPALVEQIDHLVSLYSLDYMNSDKRKELSEVVESERENGGIENLIKYHKGLVNDSKNTLFAGDPLNVTKGYLPDVTNQYRDVTVAYSEADADRLRSAMYIEVGPLQRSPADQGTFTPIMFYTEDAGKQQHISGAIALYNHGAKGREVDMDTTELAYAINQGRSYLGNDKSYNPFQSMDGMIPRYDTQGKIIGYRYEMAAGTRDKYLERNNDFSDLVGAFTSLGYTKLANVAQNKKVVRALKDIYDGSKAWDRKKFVYVSYESTDPVAYAAWDKLSHETKEEVKKTWGRYGMWVSNETFLTVFGHAKKSLFTQAFDKDDGYRNVAEEFYVTLMKGLFGKNSRVYAAKSERMWQEMVALTKNFVVIRNVSTLVFNVAANTFLLAAHGVPMGDIIQHTKDSILGGIQHRKDLALITKLEARQRSGIGDPVQLQNEINVIRNRMQQNPMHSFIEAGMFSGIVEDIDPSTNMYSYQSSLQRKFEGKYEKLPKMLRRGIEYAFVTPSTPLYQFLHSSTQYSDFSAKYVLYKYYTERAPKKLSHEDAIQEASNNFINYDVPTSPWMQYANDMGILMFTKYNLRIQKAMFKLIAERPASALSQALLMDQFSSLPPGIDPIVFNQMGNPFRTGAFGLFDVLDEPFPIKLLT